MKPAKLLLSILIFSALGCFGLPVREVLASDASLLLAPNHEDVEKGETLDVDIVVNTWDAEVSAVEIYMNFDPGKFEVAVDTSTSVFDEFAPESGRVDNEAGKVYFVAWTSVGSPFVGEGTVATLKVTAKVDSGEGDITFVFVPGATKDACLVVERETVENILSIVSDGNYILIPGSDPTPTPTSAPDPTATPTPADDGGDDSDDGDCGGGGCPIPDTLGGGC